MALRASDHADPTAAARAPANPHQLCDAASGRFNPVRLRAAIVARVWTVGEFAATPGISRAWLYNALGGQAVSDRTAIRIANTLGAQAPMSRIEG